MSNPTIYVRAHYRTSGEARPHWLLIHDAGHHQPYKIVASLHPVHWTEDLARGKQLFKREAKAQAKAMFGEVKWDGNYAQLPDHQHLFLVRP
jgi:hypothetical protein